MKRQTIYFFIFIQSLIFSFTSIAQADNLRIEPSALKTQLNQVVLIDVRADALYEAGHLPGALSFPIKHTYQDQKISGALIKPQVMQPKLRKMGITENSQVVVYDEGNLVDAARMFWALEVYGLKNVQVLNGGFQSWKKQKFAVSKETPAPAPSNYVVQINSKRLASKFQTQLASLNPNKIIIDARPNSHYVGKKSSAKRYGRIPSAINIPASHNLESKSESGFSHFQPVDLLKAVYKDIPKNKQIITYCAIGRISAANYLALRELGYEVSNYDASWKEWGNDFNLPIEKGPQKN